VWAGDWDRGDDRGKGVELLLDYLQG